MRRDRHPGRQTRSDAGELGLDDAIVERAMFGPNRPTRKKASVNNFLVSALPIPRRGSMVTDASMPAVTMNCVILHLLCRRGQRNSAPTTAGDGKQRNQNKTERKSI